MRLPIGVSDFNELIHGKYVFADKTLLIGDIINDGSKIILITRPRRFGKTLNLSMLRYFFNLEEGDKGNLFEGLNIGKDVEFCREHQHKYPVIFITFKDIKALNYEEAYSKIVGLIWELYESHRNLLEGNLLSEGEKAVYNAILNGSAEIGEIQSSIKQLSGYLRRKFNKPVILLMDEYDTPIQEAYLREYYHEMVNLMRGMLGRALKDNEHVAKAVLTGITRVSQESMFSDLNNVEVYSMLREEYGQYFGFTEDEVKQLVSKSEKEISLSAIKAWYNGYQVGSHVLYNPWSIINCLKNKGELKPYWLNTGGNELIAKLLSRANLKVKQQFEDLLQGKAIERPVSENLVFTDIMREEAALWSLLFYAGYLNVLSSESGGVELIARMAIPNKEVGFAYERVVRSWFNLEDEIDAYKDFVHTLMEGNIEKFGRYVASYMMESTSYFDFYDPNSERIFHVFILGLVVGMRSFYDIQSNREIGLGRCDVVFLPKEKGRKGIILEFKVSESEELLKERAGEALKQIQDKRYTEVFRAEGVGDVLCVGMAFCGKRVALMSERTVISFD